MWVTNTNTRYILYFLITAHALLNSINAYITSQNSSNANPYPLSYKIVLSAANSTINFKATNGYILSPITFTNFYVNYSMSSISPRQVYDGGLDPSLYAITCRCSYYPVYSSNSDSQLMYFDASDGETVFVGTSSVENGCGDTLTATYQVIVNPNSLPMINYYIPAGTPTITYQVEITEGTQSTIITATPSSTVTYNDINITFGEPDVPWGNSFMGTIVVFDPNEGTFQNYDSSSLTVDASDCDPSMPGFFPTLNNEWQQCFVNLLPSYWWCGQQGVWDEVPLYNAISGPIPLIKDQPLKYYDRLYPYYYPLMELPAPFPNVTGCWNFLTFDIFGNELTTNLIPYPSRVANTTGYTLINGTLFQVSVTGNMIQVNINGNFVDDVKGTMYALNCSQVTNATSVTQEWITPVMLVHGYLIIVPNSSYPIGMAGFSPLVTQIPITVNGTGYYVPQAS